MSRIFIERPIFAWVLAIIIMLGGIGAIFSLPVAQYPDVAPTQINANPFSIHRTLRRGRLTSVFSANADSATVEVAAPIRDSSGITNGN